MHFRCCKFYQSLEGALVSGGCVLIEHFPCTPADPSLHPLLSLRHSWRNGGPIIILSIGLYFVIIMLTSTVDGLTKKSVVDTHHRINFYMSIPFEQ